MAARAFSSHRQQGLLFSAFCGLLIVIALLLWNTGSRARGFNGYAALAQLLRRVLGLPGTGIKPVSSALAGRLLSTVPPGTSEARLMTHLETPSGCFPKTPGPLQH